MIGLGLVWLLRPERNPNHPVCIQRLALLGSELGLRRGSQAGGKEAGAEKGFSLEDGTNCLPKVWSDWLSQLESGWAYPEAGANRHNSGNLGSGRTDLLARIHKERGGGVISTR